MQSSEKNVHRYYSILKGLWPQSLDDVAKKRSNKNCLLTKDLLMFLVASIFKCSIKFHFHFHFKHSFHFCFLIFHYSWEPKLWLSKLRKAFFSSTFPTWSCQHGKLATPCIQSSCFLCDNVNMCGVSRGWGVEASHDLSAQMNT